MASSSDELKVIFRAETERAIQEIKRFSQHTKSTQNSIESMAKSLIKSAAAPLAAVASFQGLKAIMKDMVSAYAEQEQAEAKLASAIRSSGGSVEELLPKYSSFASEIQKVTTVGDEATMQILQQGLSYGITTDKIEDATRGAIGLSKAFGIDSQAAIKAVANAMQGNYETLQRYLPALKTVTNDTEKAAIVQKAMADGFAIAKSEASTSTGSMILLKNSVGDLKEAYGRILAEGSHPFTKWLTKTISDLTEATTRTYELSKAQRAMAEGRADEVSAEQKIAVYRAQINDLLEAHKYLTDENTRGMRIYEGVTEEQASADAAAISMSIRNLRGKISALEAAAMVEKRAAEAKQREEEAEKRRSDAAKKAWQAQIAELERYESGLVRAANHTEWLLEQSSKPLGEGMNRDAWEDDAPRQIIAYERSQEEIATLHEKYADKRVEVSWWEADEIKRSLASIAPFYQTMSQGIMDLWSMQLQMNREAGQAAIDRLQKEQDAFEENFKAQKSLKEQLGIDTAEFEEEMEARRQAMEEARVAKENSIKKKLFEQEKKMNVAQAIMSGAEAAVNALKAAPPPYNFALAALVTAFTAAKVGMIQSQKYPALAEGGIVQPSPGGSLVRVAEAGKPELVTPLDKAGIGTTIIVNLNAGVVGDRDAVASWVHEAIKRAQRTGALV